MKVLFIEGTSCGICFSKMSNEPFQNTIDHDAEYCFNYVDKFLGHSDSAYCYWYCISQL